LFGQTMSRASDSILRSGFDAADDGLYTDADAARFLAQTTFGPTSDDIRHLRTLGYRNWLAEQQDGTTTPATHALEYVAWTQQLSPGFASGRMEAWFLGAMGGPDPRSGVADHHDQLRQRVAFALSQILVTSDTASAENHDARYLPAYYDMLVDDAFGN